VTPASEKAAALEALADRVEGAQGDNTAELLSDAWDELGPVRRWSADKAGRFGRLIDAEGFIDAAEMLVPVGCEWRVSDPANADGSNSIFGYPTRCHAYVVCGDREHNYGATPALALCSAALRSAAALARSAGV